MALLLRAARRPSAALASLIVYARPWLLPSPTMPRRWWPPAIGLGYIALIGALGGLGPQHVVLGGLGLLDAYNEKTRLFLRTCLPFIVTGAIYDSLRYYLAAGIAGRVHVAGPYLLERAWFGIGGHTLNEVFAVHHGPLVDLVTGAAYLLYVAEYLSLAMLELLAGRVANAAVFARCFFAVNVLGMATYFVYPAAPPWYVAAHGLGPAQMTAVPSEAAAHRFDALLGTHLFEGVYGHSVEVFGAIPSLHVAYPLMAAILAFQIRSLRWARWPAVIYAAIMCLAAVYLQHHYVIDVLIGLAYGAAVVVVVQAWGRRRAASMA